MAYQSFEELEVWKKACRLAVNTCGLLKNSNAFYMRDQMQRAEQCQKISGESREIAAMLQGLIRSLEGRPLKTENLKLKTKKP
jgi:hypothetical protein